MAITRENEHRRSRFRRREKPRGERCLNCGAEVADRYCPHCGQENVPADLTLGAVLREFFAELLYYDSKMWRTLRMLVCHPGRLSTEWALGRRTLYLSPIRLYLSVTFLFFVFAAWHGTKGIQVTQPMTPKQQQALIKELTTKQFAPTELALMRESLKSTHMTPDMRQKVDDALQKAQDRADARAKTGIPISSDDQALLNSSKLKGWFGTQIKKVEIAAIQDPNAFTRRYVDQFPKVLFIVLPLFAVVLKLLYVRQKRYFVEHLVFILHLHSFAFLVLLPAEIIPGRLIPDVVVPLIVMLWLPIYAFVAMLRFYRQPWWLTGFKGLVLNGAYLLLMAGGALLALIFTVSSYDDPKPGQPNGAKPTAASPAAGAPGQTPSLPGQQKDASIR